MHSGVTESKVTRMDLWEITHRSFIRSGDAGQRPPLVIVGSAFQDLTELFSKVAATAQNRSVLLIELPGHGTNEQSSGELSHDHFADLLARFLTQIDVPKVIPVGLSYGAAAIAYAFAARHPEMVSAAIISGSSLVASETLKGVVKTLNYFAEQDRLDAFLATSVLHLVNPLTQLRPGSDQPIGRALQGRFSNLSKNRAALGRFEDHVNRALWSRVSAHPACSVLFLAGQQDSFIRPHETLALARQCPQGIFGVVHGTDHMAAIQEPALLANILRAFAAGEDLAGIRGVDWLDPHHDALDPRMAERYDGANEKVWIQTDDGRAYRGRLVNVNVHGCLIDSEADISPNKNIGKPSQISIGRGISTPAFLLSRDGGLRYYFLRTNVDSFWKFWTGIEARFGRDKKVA